MLCRLGWVRFGVGDKVRLVQINHLLVFIIHMKRWLAYKVLKSFYQLSVLAPGGWFVIIIEKLHH